MHEVCIVLDHLSAGGSRRLLVISARVFYGSEIFIISSWVYQVLKGWVRDFDREVARFFFLKVVGLTSRIGKLMYENM